MGYTKYTEYTEYTAAQSKELADSYEERKFNEELRDKMGSVFFLIRGASAKGETNCNLDLYEREDTLSKLFKLANFIVKREEPNLQYDGSSIFGEEEQLPREHKLLLKVIIRLLELGYGVSNGKQCYLGDNRGLPKYYIGVDWSGQ